jgi:peptidyl-prolyl cis-trans isomerase D
MLSSLREGAKSGVMKIFLMGFLVFAVAGLVLMDVQGMYRGGISSNTVASIEKIELEASQFEQMVRSILRQQGLNSEMAYRVGYIDKILHSEINKNILHLKSIDYGIRVNDTIVANQIASLIDPYVNENLSREEAFKRILMGQGMSEREFVSIMKADMGNNIVQSTLSKGYYFITLQEAIYLHQYDQEERSVEYLFFPDTKIKEETDPPIDEIRNNFEKNIELYAIPETREFSIAYISRAQLKDEVSVSEEELLESYDLTIDTFKVPEQRVINQAILPSSAEAIAVIESFNDVKDLKKAVINVQGSEELYQGQATFQKDGLLEEIAEPAFASAEGEILQPIESPLGWHVMVVDEVIAPYTQSFDEVKDQLKEELELVYLEEQLLDLANSIDDLVAGGSEFNEVVEELSLDVKDYGPVREDGSTLDSKEALVDISDQDRTYVIQTVFELLEDETAPVMELSNGNFILIKNKTVNEKSYKDFEEVKDNLIKVWGLKHTHEKNRKKVMEYFKNIISDTETFDNVSKEQNINILSAQLVRKSSSPEFNDKGKDTIFDTPKGEYAFIESNDGFTIAKVTSVKIPEITEELIKELESFRLLKSKMAEQEILSMYINNLYTEYKIKINHGLISKMFGPGNESF